MTCDTIIVTGSRDWTDRETIDAWLTRMIRPPLTRIAHGACRGVDTIAAEIAVEMGLEEVAYPARWAELGKRAGFERNERMVAAEASRAWRGIAFTTRKFTPGTKDCVGRMVAHGVPVLVVTPGSRP